MKAFRLITSTRVLTTTALIYPIADGTTAAAATRFALKLFLGDGFKMYSSYSRALDESWIIIFCHYFDL